MFRQELITIANPSDRKDSDDLTGQKPSPWFAGDVVPF